MELRSVEAIVRTLNDNKVDYLIVGGLAVNAHGYQRATDDVDLVMGLAPENVIRGLHALESIGYHMAIPVTPEQFANAAQREKWRREKNMVVLKLWSDVHRSAPVDVFVYEPFEFSSELALAEWQEIEPGLKAPVVRLQTLLELKRSAGRLQDLADIEALDEIRKLRESSEQ